jgi:hypothetical protein
VIDVVSGVHANNVLDGFDAPLGVQAVVLPLFGRKRFQQHEIGLPCRAEVFERFARVPLLVMARGGPDVLIKCLNRRSGRAKNLPHPPAPDDFRIGQVRENLRNGPFPRSGRLRNFDAGTPLIRRSSFFAVPASTFSGSNPFIFPSIR